MGRLLRKLTGRDLPEGFSGRLEETEHVLATTATRDGAHLVATSLGLWVPNGEEARRIGWHLISKAGWTGDVLEIIESEEHSTAGAAVLLVDRPPRRFALPSPGKLPQTVQERVTRSVRSSHRRELGGGGAVFVQRKMPGKDGVVLQVRSDSGTDSSVVAAIAAQVAAQLPGQHTEGAS
ncbi:MAG: hypothetical protein GEU98_26385 [Pseudonocardiaceae bacterium]|nr:hypothetical protein [Pseudonocardiaceae bacterium]